MNTLRVASMCFGIVNLLVGVVALLFPIGVSLFYPHDCFSFSGMVACLLEDERSRQFVLLGVLSCLSAYVYMRKWQRPRVPYAVALVLIATGAAWCLASEQTTLAVLGAVMALAAGMLIFLAPKSAPEV